ncbi:MAG: roadblock/LC7 domain-containing protein [Caldisericia bacterium]
MAEGLVSVVISDEDLKRIDDYLAQTLADSQAKNILLTDRSGQLITKHGSISRRDASNISALSAGLFSATNELAKLLGEKEFTVTFHQGEEANIHISLLVPQILLVIVFDNRAPIGAIRFWSKKISSEISPFLKNVQTVKDRKIEEKEGFEEEIENKLDNLF